MEYCGADIAGQFRKVVTNAFAGNTFDGMEASQRRLGHQATRDPDGVCGDASVVVRIEIVRIYDRGRHSIGARNADSAARRRAQIAGGDGYGREAVKRVSELVERERLHMELDVGARLVGTGSGEDAELRWCHGERTATAKGVVESHRDFPES